MLTQKKRPSSRPALEELFTLAVPAFDPAGFVQYLGVVNYATTDRVLQSLITLTNTHPTRPISLLVSSAGGPTGIGMSFYDSVRSVLKLDITTIGSGDVDSSGMLIFLSGRTRFVTKHTTALLHPAGRVFDSGKRVTASELASMAREDRLKDAQYASVVAENSRGRLTAKDVQKRMEKNTVLTPEDFITYGLADAII